MKKTAAIILVLAMALSLCGCADVYDPAEKAPVPKYSVCVDFSQFDEDNLLDEESGALIFTQSICAPVVLSAGSDRAADKINLDLERQNAVLLERASAMKDTALSFADDDARLDYSMYGDSIADGEVSPLTCVYRSNAVLTRGDTGVLSLSFDTFTYSSGAAHGYVARESLNYDAKTGEKLTLDGIAEEPDLLRQLAYGYLLNISKGEKYQDNGASIFFEEDLTEALSALVESEQWYLSDEGLVFYANPYEMAPYGYGRIDFTVPYAAMEGLIMDKYVPVDYEGENGMMLAEAGDNPDRSSLKMLSTVTLDEDMQSVVISAEETVYSVSLVKIVDAGMYSYEENILWYRSYMTTDEAVELICSIPDVQPNVILRYTLADGTVIERGIFQSGEDGSIMLVELQPAET